jgi:hypothetical protein
VPWRISSEMWNVCSELRHCAPVAIVAHRDSVAEIIMRRFIITVLLTTILHAIGCILAPPFEFGHSRAECFFFTFVSGIVGLFAVLLLPLRAELRRFMPASTPRIHALLAFSCFMRYEQPSFWHASYLLANASGRGRLPMPKRWLPASLSSLIGGIEASTNQCASFLSS